MKYYLYLLVFFLFTSCGGPEKFFTDGNYEKAYKKALKDIQSGKKDRTLNTILNKSMIELIEEATYNSEALLRSDVVEDWEEAYKTNEELLSLYYKGKRYLDSSIDIDMQLIEENNDLLKEDIVLAYIALGDSSMEAYIEYNDKQAAQKAYHMFTSASKYNATKYENNLRNKLEEALFAGTVFINVTVDVWDRAYKYEIERQFEDLEDNDELFYEVTFDEFNDNTDCQLDILFSRLNVNVTDQTRSETYREEVQEGYEEKIDTSGNRTRVPILKEVTGEVRITEEIRLYTWDIRVDGEDKSNYCDFRYNQFQVAQEAVITNYQTLGDARAIPESFRNAGTQTFSNNDERRLIDELIDQAFDEIERYYFDND